MRVKDERKRVAVFNAAAEQITEKGLAATSVSSVAAAAGISPATIYTYFESKEDMINQLYFWVKEQSAFALLAGIEDCSSLRSSLERLWHNLFGFALAEPVKFKFGEQIAYSPAVGSQTKAAARGFYEPLFGLLSRGVEQGLLRPLRMEVLAAQVLAPIVQLVRQHLYGELELTDEIINEAFELSWSAISY